MFCCFYDIIAEAFAAQCFPALTLLAVARKYHEMCGYVTFCEIWEGCFSPEERTMLIRLSPNAANKVSVSVLRLCVAAALPGFGLLDKYEHSY